MGICNKCTLANIKMQARKTGAKVSVRADKGWQDMFPKAMRVTVNGEFRAMLAEVPERCVC